MRNFRANRIILLTGGEPSMLPVASFTFSDDNALEITFTDTSVDPDGSIISWDWDFGDGSGTSSLQNPVYTYAAPGEYEVTLIVEDDDLNTDEYVLTIRVNAVPVAGFTFVDNNGREIDFTDTSTDDDGIVAWSWDFGDSIGTSSSQNPTYVYASPGTYDVVLTVTDTNGATDDITISVTPNENPTAGFTYVEDGLEVTFTDTSTDGDGTVDEWSWDFGDSVGTSTSQNPVYTYASAGTYNVTLTVTDNDGATDVYEEEVTVEEAVASLPSIRDMFVSDTFTTNAQEISIFTEGIQETDLLIVIHATDGNETVVPPVYISDSSDAGYGTEITEQVGGDDTLTIWAKEATSDDVDEDLEITWGTIERSVASMLVIRNHDGIDGAASTNFSGGTATATPTSPDLTTTVDNCLIIRGLVVDDNNSGNFGFPTPPTGTELIMHTRNFGGSAGGVMLSIAIEEQPTAGSVGTAQWTISTNRGSVGFTIAIAPGVLGGTSPDISTGLVDMWDLEDTSAALDPTHDLTLVNSPTFTTGLIGNALKSEVTTKYANVPHANATALYPGLGNFTIVTWLYSNTTLDSLHESGGRGGISIGDNTPGPSFSFDYRPNLNSVIPLFFYSGTTSINQYFDVNYSDSTWQFFVIRVSRRGFMSAQRDKIWYGQREISSQAAVDLTPADAGIRIGYGAGSSTSGALWDSVMLYHKVLEYDNSLTIYNEGAGISSLDLP
jgi:PKD repeat protein